MKDIKYQYAYDENDSLVSIGDYTKETSKQHTFTCIVCGSELRPRAIGSKHRRAHFYHKEIVSCNGESYLHKLGKLYIKNKFDNSDSFVVSYDVSKSCNKHDCNLRNYNCYIEHETNKIDLKEFYDTCTIETTINGYIADLLITNSKDKNIPPILIEVCVTHPCEEDKKNSGLKIIEISIKGEKDIEKIFTNGVLSENLNKRIGGKIEFFSFKRKLEESMVTEIHRAIYNPSLRYDVFINTIKCDIADCKRFNNSIVELNITNNRSPFTTSYDIACDWIVKHFKTRRCDICKFYYRTEWEEYPYCRLSKNYGRPKFPEMEYAEKCSSFNYKANDFLEYDKAKCGIFEVEKGTIITKNDYRVIIAGSKDFDDYTLFEEKCNYVLAEKMKTHNVIILAGTSYRTVGLIEQFSYEHNLIVIPFGAEWGRHGQNAGYKSNEEMIKVADALIAFWDGKSRFIEDLIKRARNNGLKVKVVHFSSDEKKPCAYYGL